MSSFEIRHHTEFDKAWQKATADGKLTKEEIVDLKKAAAKTADPKSLDPTHTDDFLVGQLEAGKGGEVTFTHTGGKNVTAELRFVGDEAVVVTKANFKELADKVQDPKVPAKEREALLLDLIGFKGGDPKLLKALLFKIVDKQGSPSRDMRELAAGTLADRGWGDVAAYEGMLKDTHPSIRRAAIQGLGRLGTEEAVQVLVKHHGKTPSEDDKGEVIRALWRIEEQGPAKESASKHARVIGKKADDESVAAYRQAEAEKATTKSIGDKVATLGNKDSKEVKAYLAAHGDDVLNYGSAADKGKMVGILLKDDSPEAKKWVKKLLLSAWTAPEMNALVGAMLKVTGTPPNLKNYLGEKAYSAFNDHRSKVYGLDRNIQVNTTQIAKSGTFEKKVLAIKEHVEYAKVGIEDKEQTAERVKDLLISLGSREEYELALSALAAQGVSEKDLIGLLGESGRKEVFQAYEKGPVSKVPNIDKGKAPKWSGGKVSDFAAKGSHTPDHHQSNMHHFIHQLEGKALEKGVHYGGALLLKLGFKAAGHALEKLALPVEIAHQFYGFLQEWADVNGPGQWRLSAHWGYQSGYADAMVSVTELWQNSKGLEDFMAKLPTVMKGIGTIDMDEPNSAFRSFGKYSGNRDAILHLVSLMDPAQGGSPEKLASFLDEMARVKQGDNVSFRENMAAAVHRKYEKDH